MLAKMRDFTERCAAAQWKGHTGKRITDIVNIGIGGSDLGPVMVTEALRPYWQAGTAGPLRVERRRHAHRRERSSAADPETTLFIVASKTFTTQETITNANTARSWLLDALGDQRRRRQALRRAVDQRQGGGELRHRHRQHVRVLGLGRRALLAVVGDRAADRARRSAWTTSRSCSQGAHDMDEHFRTAPLEQNLPVVMALLGVWYANFFGAETHAILPYDQYLHRFAAYFQQGDMESNGKGVDRQGQPDHRLHDRARSSGASRARTASTRSTS